MSVFLSACGKDMTDMSTEEPFSNEAEESSESSHSVKGEEHTDLSDENEKPRLSFVDAHGQSYEVEINPEIPKHNYDLSCFKKQGNKMTYEGDPRYRARLGVDVSYHEGDLDWKAIKEEGFEFAILRIGARGYGKEGKVFLDKMFHQNIKEAKEAGLDVGVYFFSQAINEEEAKEEAEFVLANLSGYDLELPVVYDPESILDAEARTDGVSGEQFTKNTLVFCDLIEKAGFEPMIYSNMLWEAFKFDLTSLSQYPIWYADYEDLPQTPYYFSFWQYSEKGYLDALKGKEGKDYLDLDIQLIPVKDEVNQD